MEPLSGREPQERKKQVITSGVWSSVKDKAAGAIRYLAYTSDVGEAFRPIFPLWLVRASYGVSWMYVFGDVAFEGIKEQRKTKLKERLIARVCIERFTFQVLSSILFPALTIHFTVKRASKFIRKTNSPFVLRNRRWLPTAAGLCVVPFLPVLYDHATEWAVSSIFAVIWPLSKRQIKKIKIATDEQKEQFDQKSALLERMLEQHGESDY
eukprot:TRINITY_DN18670_c0_g1_i1.p1 TRINITY_DN18670_c0_g1~~TRINITY_DN18670_c0_g1_i1.p1  ORF type:complete len:210 (-),score=31.77 TRINITY_DN18670_c0_g1_i1:209-838(-)